MRQMVARSSSADRLAQASSSSERSSIQKLFELLNQERPNMLAMPSDLQQKILLAVDQLQADDLGVGPETLQHPGLKVGYIDVEQTPEYSLCMFALKKGAHIPLHDHPKMYVFGRLLFGVMKVVSFDLEDIIDKGTRRKPRRQWARMRSLEVHGPDARSYWLAPDIGNLHYLEAVEDCCFFDVVTPPYNSEQGRDCTYYQLQIDLSDAVAGERYEVQQHWPENFYTEPLRYKGR